MSGYIKISRNIVYNWIWDNPERLKWWLDLLFMAAWRDDKQLISGKIEEVPRGSLIISIRGLQDRWAKRDYRDKVKNRPGIDTIRRFLTDLCEERVICMCKTGQGNTLVTICNYDKYQVNEIKTGQPRVSYGSNYKEKREKNQKRNKEILETGKEKKEKISPKGDIKKKEFLNSNFGRNDYRNRASLARDKRDEEFANYIARKLGSRKVPD